MELRAGDIAAGNDRRHLAAVVGDSHAGGVVDDDADEMPFTSAKGEVREWKISRKGVARFLARAAQTREYTGQAVALSGGAAS